MKEPNASGWWWSVNHGHPVRVFMVRRKPADEEKVALVRLANGVEAYAEDLSVDRYEPIHLHEVAPAMIGVPNVPLLNILHKLEVEREPLELGVVRRTKKKGREADPHLRDWIARLRLINRAIEIVETELHRCRGQVSL